VPTALTWPRPFETREPVFLRLARMGEDFGTRPSSFAAIENPTVAMRFDEFCAMALWNARSRD
jgi:hypothetical protein